MAVKAIYGYYINRKWDVANTQLLGTPMDKEVLPNPRDHCGVNERSPNLGLEMPDGLVARL